MNNTSLSRILTTLTVLFILVAAPVCAEELSGSDYVRLGKPGTVTGTLFEEDGEWYLTAGERIYEVHLGNYTVLYPDGLNLQTGEQAVIHGFIYQNNIAVISVETRGKTWTFRNEDGSPRWAGRGNGRNANQPYYNNQSSH